MKADLETPGDVSTVANLRLTVGKNHRSLEALLILIAIALACLLYEMAAYKLVVLNLFYLPVVLGAFFLGRYRAGVLALFCVISASLVIALGLYDFAAFDSPLVVGLAVATWAAVLGLTALLVGTLSDENSQRIVELHEAHVGMIGVLARYLQSSDPTMKARSHRVAELSQQVAMELRMSPREIDDIRVAAMLHDLGDVEVTTRVIRKAIGNLEVDHKEADQYTFHGTDLVHSLGSVLTGVFPLLINQDMMQDRLSESSSETMENERPLGAMIIHTVRTFDCLIEGDWGRPGLSAESVLAELRAVQSGEHTARVVQALQRVVRRQWGRRATVDDQVDSSTYDSRSSDEYQTV